MKNIQSLFLSIGFNFRLDYDQILDEEHTKLIQTQQYPSECQYIWNDVFCPCSEKSKNSFLSNNFFVSV